MTQPGDPHSLDWMTPQRTSEALSWEVPDGWQQGRGAFGGIVVGAMLRAVAAYEPDAARQVRSITAELIGPVLPGPSVLEVRCLRRGNALSTWEVSLTQPAQPDVLAHAVVLSGSPRSNPPQWSDAPSRAMPPWRELPVATMPPPLAPVFAQHFEYRLVEGAPFSGAEAPRVAGYVRSVGAAAVRDPAYLAAHADAFWPVVLPTFRELRPVATVSFALHLHGSIDLLQEGEPILYLARGQAASGGYVSETRELYTPRGELLALNHQLVAVIK